MKCNYEDFGKRIMDRGYSSAELLVVILVIALLIAAMLPAMSSLVHSARLAGAKQDAASIGAAIELLKMEGRFDLYATPGPSGATPGPSGHPIRDEGGSGLYDLVFEISGTRYRGSISELQADGSFLYTLIAGGAVYVVRYDASTGNVDEVA